MPVVKSVAEPVTQFVRDVWAVPLAALQTGEESVRRRIESLAQLPQMGGDEARRLLADLTRSWQERREEMERAVEQFVSEALGRGLPSPRDELRALRDRAARLSARCRELESRLTPTPWMDGGAP